ncbi:MAG: hypothetical protein Q8N60_05345 [Candidatus Diapherotrites archaeon]|nr:hypothetical protein [Candidatus Diapherotrites archaeon]
MGLFDRLKAKKGEIEAQKKAEEKAEPEGKYNEACALCGNPGTEKKWMGQYWHKKCYRSARKGARKMI